MSDNKNNNKSGNGNRISEINNFVPMSKGKTESKPNHDSNPLKNKKEDKG